MTKPPRAWVRPNHRTKKLHPSRRRWEVKYEDPLTRLDRTKGGFKSKQAAEDWRDEFVSKVRSGTYIDPQAATITFNALANEWHRNTHFDRARTEDDYRKIINGPKSPTNLRFGRAQLGDMTHDRIAEYIASGLDPKKPRAPQTVRNHFYVIKAVLDYAVRTRRILANPAEGIKLPQQRKPWELEDDRYPLTPTETQHIAANTTPPYDMYVLLLGASGARPEEVSALTLTDANTTDGTISITKVIVEASGKLILEPYTKTSHSRRTVTLDSATLRHLQTYLTEHRSRALAWFTAHPEHPNPGDVLPLFVGWEDGRGGNRHKTPLIDRLDFSQPIRPSAFVKQLWHRAREQAGIPSGVTPYSLRHAHISLLVDRIGQPGALTLKEIQQRVGHSSAVTTLDRYAHRSRPDRDAHRTALDAALAPELAATNVVPIKRDA